jgi:hypothetical protein
MLREPKPRPPTQRQLDYAERLVARLKEANQLNASSFERKVQRCQDIGEMSSLIDQMKKHLQDIQDADYEAGLDG